ncbi:hypothetical protein DL770_004796 [Monosporascus sp. CRB-9-2]|nr:hypothetical protein DL770_004796 [Monosporascus sp. CRB-9-2]
MALLYTEIPKDHIRLLHLGPGSGKDVVEATIETVSLHAANEYDALSYVWGKKIKKKAIRCNGMMVDATQNLVGAMKHLRYPDRSRVLWIDALCINQKDKNEKSTQVMMMGDIYSRAVRTAIWLGPADYTSDIALAFIRKTFDDLIQSPNTLRSKMDGELPKVLGIDSAAIERRLAEPDSERRVSTSVDSDLLEEISDDEQRASVALLLRREWWTRIWIIQELCLSKEAVVVCGNSSVPWEAMTFAVAELGGPDDSSSDSDDDDSLERSLAEISRYRSLSTARAGLTAFDVRPRLQDALISFRWFHATNPLDKVYALLSITDSLGVSPDYNVGPKQCFEDVARRIITQSTDLDILDLVVPSFPLTSRDTPDLATWAPDWSQTDVSDFSIRGNAESATHPIFDRDFGDLDTGKEEPLLTSQARFNREEALVLRGIVIESINHLHDSILLPGSAFLADFPMIRPSTTAGMVVSLAGFALRFLLRLPKLCHHLSLLAEYGRSLLHFSGLATTIDPTMPLDSRFQSANRLLSLCMRGIGEPTTGDVKEFLEGHNNVTEPKWDRLVRLLGLPKLLPWVYHTIRGVFVFILESPMYEDRDRVDEVTLEDLVWKRLQGSLEEEQEDSQQVL